MSGQRTDPTDSVFASFSEPVQAAIKERGFESPTDPQRQAIPPILAGEHTLVIAPTGSGKTETAMLPVFDHLVSRSSEETHGFGALYITPLRALNRDMQDRLEWWAETLSLTVDVRHGDTSQYDRRKQATDPPDILVTTPETLQAMLTGSTLRTGLETVSHVIVDEVHELANAKRGAQLSIGLEHLRDVAGPMQRIGLSATVGDPSEVGRFLTGDRGCAIIEVDIGSRLSLAVRSPQTTAADTQLAGELVTDVQIASHVREITSLIEENQSTLIFVNTRQTAEALGSRLAATGASIGIHHGSLAKEARITVEEQFKAGEIAALLCTSSMELGIDVGRIDHVIQYQSPREVTRLLQRVGRAGHRLDAISTGSIIASDADDIMESVAIADAALTGDVEPARVHTGSLDTVANQVVGLVMGAGEISGARAYAIISHATPFAHIDETTMRRVITTLADNRIIWLDEASDTLSKTGQTWQYFYANLSMIPDEATYTVQDMASGSSVGTLDERYVINFATQGSIFVQGGRMWRVVEVDEENERVRVAPIEDPAGEVPSWVGQEIPVPYAIAQRVGNRRAAIDRRLEADPEATCEQCFPSDFVDSESIRIVRETIKAQRMADAPLPTDERLVIESGDGTILLNTCLGHRTNETLGRMLAALLGQRTGSSIGLDVDPYRIDLEVPRTVRPSMVEETLHNTDPAHISEIIELSLKGSEGLSFRLAQVATKFGALKNWQAGQAGRPPRRLLDTLIDTPIYEEAVRELFHEELDVDRAEQVLASIQSNERELVIHHQRTPIGTDGRTGVADLLTPENADASVIETVKERILDDHVRLLCMHCTEWSRKRKVRRVDDQPICPTCGSTRIAALNPWDTESVEAVQSKNKDEAQEKATKRAYRSANLVQSHGKDAVIALAARGVGPHNAARIIGKLRETEAEFYRDLLVQERQYARTRSFWD